MTSTTKPLARAVNIRAEPYDVYCGRGRGGTETKWGNPFKQGSQDQNVRDFEAYLRYCIRTGEFTPKDLQELEGKRLGCFCKPKPCHADIIADAVNNPEEYGLQEHTRQGP